MKLVGIRGCGKPTRVAFIAQARNLPTRRVRKIYASLRVQAKKERQRTVAARAVLCGVICECVCVLCVYAERRVGSWNNVCVP